MEERSYEMEEAGKEQGNGDFWVCAVAFAAMLLFLFYKSNG